MISLGTAGASFSGIPTSGPAPLQVQFSVNSGSEIATWSWDFGDGSYGSGMSPVHSYITPGNYTVKLTVIKDQGAVNYLTSSYFFLGQESTWQKEAMIHVTGSVNNSDLVSSGSKEMLTPATGLLAGDSTEQPGLIIQYRPAMYQAVTLQKAQPLDFPRGKQFKMSSGLSTWRTATPGNGK